MQAQQSASQYKSGELAQLSGVNTETLRYYEREALLPQPKRSDAGYRLYGDDDVQRVRFIKRAQDLGFSLKEIKELLTLKFNKRQSAASVKKITAEKINAIEAKIKDLQAMKQSLTGLYDACSGEGDIAHCPIIQCLDSNTTANATSNPTSKKIQRQKGRPKYGKEVITMENNKKAESKEKTKCPNPACKCDPCLCDPCLCE